MAEAKKPDPSVAERALAEAKERRAKEEALDLPPEINGPRSQAERVRFGDWEKDGIAYDF